MILSFGENSGDFYKQLGILVGMIDVIIPRLVVIVEIITVFLENGVIEQRSVNLPSQFYAAAHQHLVYSQHI